MTDPETSDSEAPDKPPPAGNDDAAKAAAPGVPAVGPPRPRRRRDPLAVLFGLGVVLLIAAVVYVWQHPIGRRSQPQPVTAVSEPVADFRLVTLEQQLAALTARVDALEHRPVPAPALTPPDLAPLEARIAALEQRPAPTPVPASGPSDPALSERLGALNARLDTLKADLERNAAALGGRIATDESRLTETEREAGQMGAAADRAGRIARIEAAAAALAAGRPLGTLPDAPPALSRFATAAPPTEASLRLAFPAAARTAMAAAAPPAGGSFWSGMLNRLGAVITIRRGDEVILGSPVDGVIAVARQALDAGDLAGAVATIDRLEDGPAHELAAWRAEAQALLDARAALAAMAAHA